MKKEYFDEFCEKYEAEIAIAEREYRDTEGDLTRAVIAALCHKDADSIDHLPSIDQSEIMAWELYTLHHRLKGEWQSDYAPPKNWEGVHKQRWIKMANHAMMLMNFARG